MRNVFALGTLLVPLVAPVLALGAEAQTGDCNFHVGLGKDDITPAEAVMLAGSPAPVKSSSVETRLFVKAMVISAGKQSLAIVTLDTLKYPTDLAVRARQQVERATRIPARNIIICASHTHSGPLWSQYKDRLISSIVKTVALAVNDLTPCTVRTSRGVVEGVSENRRVLIDGEAWNRWQLKPTARARYPAAGPADPECEVLAAVGQNGRYKAILYSFACHAAATRDAVISADYPGHVQQYVEKQMGYDVTTFFLPGACGDVNPGDRQRSESFGEKLGETILKSLRIIEPIARPTLRVETREEEMPGRQSPRFQEKEISLKWPGQLEHYRKTFEEMKKQEKPTYPFLYTGIRIGDEFAIVTSPDELFCEIGLSIKKQSPFKHTMVVEQTNGAHGYVPTAHAFEEGGYETWYGEHSYLSTRAGDIVKKESLEILKQLAGDGP